MPAMPAAKRERTRQMKIDAILGAIAAVLHPGEFDDVSNNGLQIARAGDDVGKVAFAVDASLGSVRAAAAAGAGMLVVHHGISWGGGIKRLTGGEFAVVKAAMDANLALAAYHLPLDANEQVGNNWELARLAGLDKISPAFSYHGNVIGVMGKLKEPKEIAIGGKSWLLPAGKIGICSGGAGEFATAAHFLGCVLFLTGEANWGEIIAAENIGMPMICAGHYETETFGVRALADFLRRTLALDTVFLPRAHAEAAR